MWGNRNKSFASFTAANIYPRDHNFRSFCAPFPKLLPPKNGRAGVWERLILGVPRMHNNANHADDDAVSRCAGRTDKESNQPDHVNSIASEHAKQQAAGKCTRLSLLEFDINDFLRRLAEDHADYYVSRQAKEKGLPSVEIRLPSPQPIPESVVTEQEKPSIDDSAPSSSKKKRLLNKTLFPMSSKKTLAEADDIEELLRDSDFQTLAAQMMTPQDTSPTLVAKENALLTELGSEDIANIDMTPPAPPAAKSFFTLRVVDVVRRIKEVVVTGNPIGASYVLSITLRDRWIETHVSSGMLVNVVFTTVDNRTLLVDEHQNWFITRPEFLIPATTLADAFACRRKPALALRFVDEGLPSAPLIVGNIVHELFEQALLKNAEPGGLLLLLNKLLTDTAEQIWHAGQNPTSIHELCLPLLRSIPTFIAKHLSHTKVVECEAMIWSMAFGLKGKLDAIISIDGCRFPLELKTGKRTDSVAHRAQTTLYCLLLADRYEMGQAWCMPPVYGLLAFLSVDRLVKIPFKRPEVTELLLARNALATLPSTMLPQRISNQWMCQQCSWQSICYAIPDDSRDALVYGWWAEWNKALSAEETVGRRANLLLPTTSVQLLSCHPISRDSWMCEFQSIGQPFTAADPVVVVHRRLGIYGCLGFIVADDGGRLVLRLSQRLQASESYEIYVDNVSSKSLAMYRTHLVKLLLEPRLQSALIKKRSSNEGFTTVAKNVAHLQTHPLLHSLDVFQREAAVSCLEGHHTLIIGMPGCGKSTVISTLIKLLNVESSLRVLVCCHTHHAVDNVLTRCLDMGVEGMCRLASNSADKVTPAKALSIGRSKASALGALHTWIGI